MEKERQQEITYGSLLLELQFILFIYHICLLALYSNKAQNKKKGVTQSWTKLLSYTIFKTGGDSVAYATYLVAGVLSQTAMTTE